MRSQNISIMYGGDSGLSDCFVIICAGCHYHENSKLKPSYFMCFISVGNCDFGFCNSCQVIAFRCETKGTHRERCIL